MTEQAPSTGEPPVLQAIPAGLAPFGSDELEQLGLYRELVSELSDWQLANRQKIDLVIGAGGVLAEDIEKADLIALATTFRKLGWLEDEPATFNKVRNLLGKHAYQAGNPEAEEIQKWLKDVKDLRAAALKQSRVAGYQLEHEDGTIETMTPKLILDMLINGAVFHSDKQLRDRWNQLGGWKSPALVLIAMVTIWDLIRMFQALDAVIAKVLASPSLRPPTTTATP
jgi:hypothetical protein